MFSEPIFYSDTKLSDRFIFQISVKHKQNTFNKITALLQEINASLIYQDVEFEIRTEYPIENMELIIDRYIKLFNIHPECIVRGRGHRKTSEQRTYDKLVEYTEKLKKYAIHINTCGDNRNSYSKTDNDATFFRMKRDYMGNDQLLSGYNIQFGVCDEYIAVCDISNMHRIWIALFRLWKSTKRYTAFIQNILLQMQDMVHSIIIYNYLIFLLIAYHIQSESLILL